MRVRVHRLGRYIRDNHLALIALVVALIGVPTAWALGRNSVGPKQIKADAVRNSELAPGSVAGPEVIDNSIRGADVEESSLGPVSEARTAASAGTSEHAGSATDAGHLDGLDSAEFLRSNAAAGGDLTGTFPAPKLAPTEGWHELNPAGGAPPAFFDIHGPSSSVSGGIPAENAECAGATDWSNYGPDHTQTAFLRDRDGFVHLQGLVKGGIGGNPGGWGGCPIFFLPQGYRPAKLTNFAVLTDTNGQAGRLEIRPDGRVVLLFGTTGYMALDGLVFRCAPSGSDGCR